MNKSRKIIGELQDFFANNDASKAINSIATIMTCIRIHSKAIGSVKNPNCKFTCLQVLQLLVLFPFFSRPIIHPLHSGSCLLVIRICSLVS